MYPITNRQTVKEKGETRKLITGEKFIEPENKSEMKMLQTENKSQKAVTNNLNMHLSMWSNQRQTTKLT